MPLLVLLIFVYNMPQALPSFAPVLNDPFWAGLLAMVLTFEQVALGLRLMLDPRRAQE